MEAAVRRLTKFLGASLVEVAGRDVRFMVEGDDGAKLRVNIEGDQQRFMATLMDETGIIRCSLDLAPISEAFKTPGHDHRVTLRVGSQLVHIDSRPTLGLELESIDLDHRTESQRMRLIKTEERFRTLEMALVD